ncbi:hypothetical protein ZIOFF_058445 [Zingiber officinale]|uniref:Secreted protein n=1 Tax=Zingiber officinale TaxID=94328 RepID=A0A8J5FFR1_ZINOF|nr:hypothetical protein ZIOFF_058445 [Zingiber officinale]
MRLAWAWAWAWVCGAEEKPSGTQRAAPGRCPCCGGAVVATEVEKAVRLCFLPLRRHSTTKFSCSRCDRRLVSLRSPLHSVMGFRENSPEKKINSEVDELLPEMGVHTEIVGFSCFSKP